MSKSYSIGDLMSIYYEREFASVDDAVLSGFSAKHNRKMKKAFDVFAKNRAQLYTGSTAKYTKRPLSLRKRLIIAAIIIVFLAFITGGVIAFISDSFRGTVYNDHTYIFSFDIGDSPSTIEEQYTLSIAPRGYELYEVVTSDCSISTEYRDSVDHSFVFTQTVKSEYNSYINTDGFTIEEVIINGCDGLCVEFARETGTSTLVIWDGEDYILELHGNFAKEELINLANSNEINGF